MSESLSSKTYEQLLREEEDSSVVDSIRQGFRRAGVSTSEVYVLDSASMSSDGVVTGLYQRSRGMLGLADIQTLLKSGIASAQISDKVAEILKHELIHKKSYEKAKSRGQEGLIAGAIGEKEDKALQEVAAGGASVEELGIVVDLCERIRMSVKKACKLVLKGEEKKIVRAAEKSGNVEIRYAA
jgi:hypothetical protein